MSLSTMQQRQRERERLKTEKLSFAEQESLHGRERKRRAQLPESRVPKKVKKEKKKIPSSQKESSSSETSFTCQ